MSDSLMPFQPAIEEPSNILPSLKNPRHVARRDGDVLLLAARVGEAQIGELHLFFFDQFQNIGGSHIVLRKGWYWPGLGPGS
jgi:hypothetical protein